MTLPHIDDATFAQATAGTPVLIEFTATWCPPCRALLPVLEAIAQARKDVHIVALDVDENPATTARLGVRAMPTLVLMRDGRAIAQTVGAQPRARIERWLDDHLR